MIDFEQLTAWLTREKSLTLEHAAHYRKIQHERAMALGLELKATAYEDVLVYIRQFAREAPPPNQQ